MASATASACSRATSRAPSSRLLSPVRSSPRPRKDSMTVALISRACLRYATMLPLPVTTLPAENTVG
jgi:hypothetical protein